MTRKTTDMTIKVVDSLDRTLATFSYPAGPIIKADFIGRGYKERWNGAPNSTFSPNWSSAEGFYVWDDSGNILAYG